MILQNVSTTLQSSTPTPIQKTRAGKLYDKHKLILMTCLPIGLTWIGAIFIYFSFQTQRKRRRRRKVFLGDEEMHIMSTTETVPLTSVKKESVTFTSMKGLEREEPTSKLSLINENLSPELKIMLHQMGIH